MPRSNTSFRSWDMINCIWSKSNDGVMRTTVMSLSAACPVEGNSIRHSMIALNQCLGLMTAPFTTSDGGGTIRLLGLLKGVSNRYPSQNNARCHNTLSLRTAEL